LGGGAIFTKHRFIGFCIGAGRRNSAPRRGFWPNSLFWSYCSGWSLFGFQQGLM